MLTRPPPPPPPAGPPRVSARALATAAASAAAQRPRRLRRPLLHALLLYPADARLIEYSQDVLLAFAMCGIDVFLQTDIEDAHSAPRPITSETVEHIFETSVADYFIVLSDRNIANRTVRARVAGHYIEMEIEKRATTILEAWAAAIKRDCGLHYDFSIAMNPNIVTSKHIDYLLQQYTPFRGIRSAYATLARLVDSTQHWLLPPRSSRSHLHSQPHSHRHDVALGDTVYVLNRSQHDSLNASRESAVPSTGKVSESAGKQPIEASNLEISAEAKKVDAQLEMLSRKALHHGIAAIIKFSNKSASPEHADEEDVLARPTLTYAWLKRSNTLSAKILRSQLLVRSLHSNLSQTLTSIANARVRTANDLSFAKISGLPSEAHRQRMLREINFLLPRVEEIGSRLSRRSKTRRRRRTFCPVNPWTSYLRNARDTAADMSRVPVFSAAASEIERNGGWRCTGCHSMNERSQTLCGACRAQCSVLESGLLPEASEAVSKRVREAIATAAAQPKPWIFAPTPIPVAAPSPPNPIPAPTSSRHGMGQATSKTSFFPHVPEPQSEPSRALPSQAITSFPPVHKRHPSFDLSDALRGANLEDIPVADHASENRFSDRAYDPLDILGSHGFALRSSLGQDGSSHYQIANGNGISVQRGRPLAGSPPLFDGSSPAASPREIDYSLRGLRIDSQLDAQRAQQGDPLRLGSSLGHLAGSSWLAGSFTGGDVPYQRVSHPSAGTSSIPNNSSPLFGGPIRAVYGSSKSTAFDPIGVQKANGTRDLPILSDGRSHANSGSYMPFSTPSQITATNGSLPIHIQQTNSHLEDLRVGSIEGKDLPLEFYGYNSRSSSNPIPVPGTSQVVSSLEALAAASDAANGGTGSATKESLRAVSAVLTEPEGLHEQQRGDHTRSYMMF